MWLSRLLLLVIAVELITMPLTQHLWTWDGFLHGGQDFELSLFMVVVCVCLALLRAQESRRGVGLLLAVRRWLSEVLGGWRTAPGNRSAAARDLRIPRIHNDAAIPLLI